MVHVVRRSRWLAAGQQLVSSHLDQFSTQLPAFNMLLLMVCSFTFPSHTSDQQVFFPICSAQQLLVDEALPLPPQVKLHISNVIVSGKSTSLHYQLYQLTPTYHSPTRTPTLLQEPLVRNPTGKNLF